MPSTRTRKRKRASSSSIAPPAHIQEDDAASQNGNEKETEVWEAFREEYVESVEQLPLSIHRNLALLNELDAQTNALDGALAQKIREYIRTRREIRESITMNGAPQPEKPLLTPRRSSARSSVLRAAAAQQTNGTGTGDTHNSSTQISTEAPRNHKLLSEISSVVNELLRAAEEKVNLAQATYDSIDRHVRLLDQAIREHELHWKSDLSTVQIKSPTFPISGLLMTRMKDIGEDIDVAPRTEPKKGADKISRSRSGTRSRRGPKRRSSSSILEPTSPDNILNIEDEDEGGVGGEAKVADMPIDPNEPRYCYCGGVSWGQMIGCDAAGCEREWFHLGCVGLTEAPKKQKWYCDECKKVNVASKRRAH